MNLNPLGSVLGNLIVCGLIQVTLVAVVATLASRFIHWRKGSSMPLLQAALAVIVLLTIAVIVPMPSWLQPQANTIETSSVKNGSSVPNTEEVNLPKPVQTTPNKIDNRFGLREALAAGLEGIRNLNQQPETKPIDQPEEVSTAFAWTTIFLALFCGGVVLGLIRLVGGLIGVRLLVNSSRPISNAKLLESVDLLAAQTRCVKTVAIHESGLVESAATVGWRRPVILLSQNWRDWTDDQLRSVLAHELAHVSRGDFLTTVLAQLGLVLHFYHPLVHWLVGRMRLEQELAADAIAAKAVGDPRIYLRAIGELALAQSSEQLSWPAHTFLPTRKTFLRRIEMLRDMKLLSGSVPIALRVCSVCVMLGVALVAVGIRPTSAIAVTPLAPIIEPQQAGLGAASTPAGESVEAHFVPADAIAVALVRTQELLPTLEKVVQASGPGTKDDTFKLLVQSLKRCTQMTIIVGPLEQASNEPFAVALEFADKASRDTAIAQLTPATQLTKEAYLSYEYESFGRNAKYLPDEKSVIFGDVETVKRMMLTGRKSASILTSSKSWQESSQASIVLNIEVATIRELQKQIPNNPVIGVFSPLWKQAKSHLLTISMNKQPGISITTSLEDPSGLEPVSTSLNSGVELLKAYVQSNAKVPPFADHVDSLMKLFESKTVSKTNDSVKLSLKADSEMLSNLVTGVLMPAVRASRIAAQRTEMTNHLKQVMLALHNYESTHGHFPPAIVIDKESGIARSWRVELLPYIDGYGPLYEQYRKDQPWDSDANKAVLEKMPALYRRPGDSSNNTSVFAAYGKGLVFDLDDKVGTKLRDITDGTSSTIAIFEGTKQVPWTKPEEIALDIDKGEFPPFGATNAEILLTGFGDGSVRALAKSIDLKTLKALFTKAGGEVGSK